MRSRLILLFSLLCSASHSAFALGGSTCATATVVGTLPYSDGGQLESGNDPNCPGEPVNDRFYVFTAPSTGIFRFDMCGSNSCCDQLLSIWGNGLCCSGSAVIINSGCADGYPLRELYMLAGQTIYLEVGKSGSEWADAPLYQFNVSLIRDVCPGTVIPALPYVHTGSTQFATHQYSGSCYTQSAPDLVFQFTAPDSVFVRASMVASWFDCLQVRKNDCASGASLLCDFGSGPDSSWFDFLAEPDSTYYFIVDGAFNSDFGSYTFALQESPDQDDCPGTVIPALPFASNGTTQFAFHQYTGSCYTQSAPDVVFNFTPADSALVRATVVAPWFDCLHVRKNNCEAGATLRCDFGAGADSSWFVFWGEPDTTYYFIVDGAYDTELGDFTFSLQEQTPSPNDVCPGTVIPALPYTDSGSTKTASHQYVGSCYGQSAPDVVYSFTSANSVLVRAAVHSPWNEALQVRKNNCDTGASLLCDLGSVLQDSSWFVFLAEPDTTYYFIVDGQWGAELDSFTFTLQEQLPLPNDYCPGTVIPNLPYTDSGSTTLASHQYAGNCYGNSAPDVVYQYTPTDSVYVRASMDGWWIGCLHVRKNDCETGASLHCDCHDVSHFGFWAEPDSAYYFIVDGFYENDLGPYTFVLQDATNELCPGTTIPSLPYTDNGSTWLAEDQYNGPCYTQSAPDVVYNFTSPLGVMIVASVNAPWWDALQLRRGNCETGISLRCDDGLNSDSSWFLFWAEPESTYYFIVDGGSAGSYGNYTLTLQERPFTNDVCPGTVIATLPYADSGTTATATNQYSGSCYGGPEPDIVYQFTPPDSVWLLAKVVATWGEVLQVRKNDCEIGASLLCDVGPEAYGSGFTFLTEPDSTYYFIVDGRYSGGSGPYTFTLEELPDFDVCPGIVIPALPFADNGSTSVATHQYSGSCYGGAEPDVVYQFTPSNEVAVRASVNASWSDALQVRKNNCTSGASLLCDMGGGADSSWFTFPAEQDSTYYFIVDGIFSGGSGPYIFSLQETNDVCPGKVIPALPYTDNGSTLNATHQYIGSCYTQLAPDVVYQFTAPESLIVRASMVATWSDALQVRKNNCATGASLLCDVGSGPDSSWFDFLAEPDSTYYFIVDGAFNSDLGPYTFTLQDVTLPNDFCPGTAIPALPYTDSGSTAPATTHQYSGSCYASSAPDVVYHFTPPDSIYIRASMVASWNDALQVRKNNCATGTSLQCDTGIGADSSWFNFWAEPDSTYYFIVDGTSSNQLGNYTFTLRDNSSDVCPGTLIPALPYTDNGSTAPATHQYNGSCYTQSAPDVVYRFTAPSSVLLRASMVATWFDCMQVRKNDCASGTSLQCDFGSGPDSSWFDFLAEQDSTYYFVVDGAFNSDFGDYTFTLRSLSCPAPDSLVIQKSAANAVLTWPPVACSSPLYNIYRSTTADVQPIPANLIGTTADTTYTDSGILSNPGLKFFYAVTSSTP